MTELRKVPLPEPVADGSGALITEIVLRPLRAKDFRGVDVRRLSVGEWDGGDLARLVANNAGVPEAVIADLPADLFLDAAAVAMSFFVGRTPKEAASESEPQTGAASSPSSDEPPASA